MIAKIEDRIPETVLVTGATGFIGSALVRRLRQRGDRVVALVRDPAKLTELELEVDEVREGDITDDAAVRRAVAGVAKVYAVAGTFREPNLSDEDYRRINVEAAATIVREAAAAGVGRVVHCSTCGVHGNVPRGELMAEDGPMNGVGIYEETKAAGAEAALRLGRELGVEVSVIRPTPVYGPGDTRLLKLFKMADTDRPMILGSGENGYHLVFIEDLVEAFLLAADRPEAAGRSYLIGGGEVPTLNELFAALGEVFGRESVQPRRLPAGPFVVAGALCESVCRPLGIDPPIYRRRVEFFTNHRAFDISRARGDLGYAPQVSMKEGLRRTAAWYRDQGMLPPMTQRQAG
jgi:nucleoside-diphosphate-sugar epimerase